jgi:hypothetical protein
MKSLRTIAQPSRKNFISGLAALALLAACGGESARAQTTVLSFENIPDTYLYRAGNQNLGTYYPGLNFGPHVTVFDQVRYGYNSADFPPHSGNAVISGYGVDQPLRVDFLGFQCTFVDAWYTSNGALSLNAYDAADNLLATTTSPGNYPAKNTLISVSAPDIAYVTFYNGNMNSLTLDDFGYTPVPEPTVLVLLAVGGVAVLRRRRT